MKTEAPPTIVNLAAERRDYTGPRLLEGEAPADPLAFFGTWLSEALARGLLDATAMALSTCSPDGAPSSRMVLLKGHDAHGFSFYTRYSTQKCADLLVNPRGALLFHWRELNRQVRIAGRIERLSRAEGEAYFVTRPRGSQLAACAASGLDRIAGAEVLERRFAEASARFAAGDVTMPEDWGGLRLTPERFEFWQGRPNRLHDRLVYELQPNGSWSRHRLAP
jgi:pyridoxamine 5'-phosphate oxidase